MIGTTKVLNVLKGFAKDDAIYTTPDHLHGRYKTELGGLVGEVGSLSLPDLSDTVKDRRLKPVQAFLDGLGVNLEAITRVVESTPTSRLPRRHIHRVFDHPVLQVFQLNSSLRSVKTPENPLDKASCKTFVLRILAHFILNGTIPTVDTTRDFKLDLRAEVPMYDVKSEFFADPSRFFRASPVPVRDLEAEARAEIDAGHLTEAQSLIELLPESKRAPLVRLLDIRHTFDVIDTALTDEATRTSLRYLKFTNERLNGIAGDLRPDERDIQSRIEGLKSILNDAVREKAYTIMQQTDKSEFDDLLTFGFDSDLVEGLQRIRQILHVATLARRTFAESTDARLIKIASDNLVRTIRDLRDSDPPFVRHYIAETQNLYTRNLIRQLETLQRPDQSVRTLDVEARLIREIRNQISNALEDDETLQRRLRRDLDAEARLVVRFFNDALREGDLMTAAHIIQNAEESLSNPRFLPRLRAELEDRKREYIGYYFDAIEQAVASDEPNVMEITELLFQTTQEIIDSLFADDSRISRQMNRFRRQYASKIERRAESEGVSVEAINDFLRAFQSFLLIGDIRENDVILDRIQELYERLPESRQKRNIELQIRRARDRQEIARGRLTGGELATSFIGFDPSDEIYQRLVVVLVLIIMFTDVSLRSTYKIVKWISEHGLPIRTSARGYHIVPADIEAELGGGDANVVCTWLYHAICKNVSHFNTEINTTQRILIIETLQALATFQATKRISMQQLRISAKEFSRIAR